MRLLVLLAMLIPAGATAAEPLGSLLVPPAEPVAGRTQADWSRAWWQWAASFEEFDSPVGDRTGSRCHLKQAGPVWFLAGTYGTRRTIRTCTVPAGKHLFFPLINYVVFPRFQDSLTCDQAKATAEANTEDVSSLVLDLDGERSPGEQLQRHRQATVECFDLAAQDGGGIAPAAANGFYIMLRPLKRGTHTLNFGGILPGMSQAVTYTLRVE